MTCYSHTVIEARRITSIAFGRVLRKARQQVGLTQEELAYRSSLHRTTVSLMERGLRCPTIDTVLHLAQALGTAPALLVSQLNTELDGTANEQESANAKQRVS